MRQEIGMRALRGHAKVIIARARMENIGGGGAAHGGADDDGTEEWAEGRSCGETTEAMRFTLLCMAAGAQGPRTRVGGVGRLVAIPVDPFAPLVLNRLGACSPPCSRVLGSRVLDSRISCLTTNSCASIP
ncbi:hypothetical protein T492DRAFT_853717 [Pavlovales sp. CCMP2436]|nr:hypothetical protein T492DRAFT_853717 [Pavlovales sp. CCMP2436]